MNKTAAYHIFLGLLVRAAFGSGIGALNGNTRTGMQHGAAVGLFVGRMTTTPVRKTIEGESKWTKSLVTTFSEAC
jgi:hypothetical protein